MKTWFSKKSQGKVSPEKKCCANCAFCAREQKQYFKNNETSHILPIEEEDREDLRDEKIEERLLKKDILLLYVGPYNENDQTNKIHNRFKNSAYQTKTHSVDNIIFCLKNQWLGKVFYYQEGWNGIMKKMLQEKTKCIFFYHYKNWNRSLQGLTEYLIQKREESNAKTVKHTLWVAIIALIISVLNPFFPKIIEFLKTYF